MKKLKISRGEARKEIENFFKEIKKRNSLDVKKIKKLAMKKRISLRENKKLFCKRCLSPFISPRIRIKKNFKLIFCEKCGKINRIKIIMPS